MSDVNGIPHVEALWERMDEAVNAVLEDFDEHGDVALAQKALDDLERAGVPKSTVDRARDQLREELEDLATSNS